MAILDDVKKGLTDVSETIVKKSNEIVEVQKLKLKKSSLEKDIREAYLELGKMYYKHIEKDGAADENAQDAYTRIVEAKEAVAELTAKLEQFSRERTCPVCGEKSSKDMVYCPHCGHKFEVCADDHAAEEAKAKVAEAKEKVGEAVESVKEKVGDAVEIVKEKIGDAAETVRHKAECAESAGSEEPEASEESEGSACGQDAQTECGGSAEGAEEESDQAE